MARLAAWFEARPWRLTVAGWLACGLVAALFLAPAIRRGGLGPADMLLGMTPWGLYRDRFPDVRGVHNPQLDPIQQYAPWRLYAAEQLRAGIVPLWNPHAYCGQPFLANVLSAVLYPFSWLAVWLPVGVFFLLSAWCHLTLAGGGMWLFLRRHNLRPAAALAGAIAAMLNPWVVGWLDYPNLSLWTYAWAPLLWWVWETAWADRRPRRLAGCAALLGLTVLGGHLQIAFYVGLSWLLYAGMSVLLARRWRDAPLYLVAPALLGGLLAAAQLLPAVELAGLSGRTGGTVTEALSWRLPATMLIGLVAPWFYGHNALDLTGGGSGGLYWGPYGNGIEASLGPGVVVCLLALTAIGARSERPVRALALVALVGLLLALGTPLYRLFWSVVPGFSGLRALARAFALVNLAAAALTGFGAEAVARGLPAGRRLAGGLLALTVALLLVGWLGEARRAAPETWTALTEGLTGWALRCTLIAIVGALTVAGAVSARRPPSVGAWPLLVAAELFVHGYGLHRGAPAELFFFATPETDWLRAHATGSRVVAVPADPSRAFLDAMPMNTPLAYGLSSPFGSESLNYAAWRRFQARFWDEEAFSPRLDHPLLALVGARYVLSRADLEGRAGLRLVWRGERGTAIYELPTARPRWWVTADWVVSPPEPWLDRLTLADVAVGRVSLPPGTPSPEPAVTQPSGVSCYGWSISPQRAVVRVGPAVDGRARWLARTEVAGPGWRALVGPALEPLRVADGVFQAVALPATETVVRFWYAPVTWRVGLFLSLLAAGALAAWGGGMERVRR